VHTLFHHFLHGARGVDFHGVEVVVALNQLRVFGELLSKGI
jgi:hypothetical protein